MIEPENTLDVPLPPHAVAVEFAPASSEEQGVA
jgi:hypothetical protein